MVLRRDFEIPKMCGADLLLQWVDMVKSVSKQTINAERLTKYRDGVATRLQRIEVALENLRTALDCALFERKSEQQLLEKQKCR